MRRLLAEHGITSYALFLTQDEGKQLPGEVEALSGFVLTGDGRVFGFWLDWNDREGRYVLAPWNRVKDLSKFAPDPEYQRARARLGLESHGEHREHRAD